jgi:hypothetical protein
VIFSDIQATTPKQIVDPERNI